MANPEFSDKGLESPAGWTDSREGKITNLKAYLIERTATLVETLKSNDYPPENSAFSFEFWRDQDIKRTDSPLDDEFRTNYEFPISFQQLIERHGRLSYFDVEVIQLGGDSDITININFEFWDDADNTGARLRVERPYHYVPLIDSLDSVTTLTRDFDDESAEYHNHETGSYKIAPMVKTEFNKLLASVPYSFTPGQISRYDDLNWHDGSEFSYEEVVTKFAQHCDDHEGVREYSLPNPDKKVGGNSGTLIIQYDDGFVSEIEIQKIIDSDMIIRPDGSIDWEARYSTFSIIEPDEDCTLLFSDIHTFDGAPKFLPLSDSDLQVAQIHDLVQLVDQQIVAHGGSLPRSKSLD